jgi:hypothetical protein
VGSSGRGLLAGAKQGWKRIQQCLGQRPRATKVAVKVTFADIRHDSEGPSTTSCKDCAACREAWGAQLQFSQSTVNRDLRLGTSPAANRLALPCSPLPMAQFSVPCPHLASLHSPQAAYASCFHLSPDCLFANLDDAIRRQLPLPFEHGRCRSPR